MKPVWWMAGSSAASWLIAAAFLSPRTAQDVLFGMIGPLAVASGTWMFAERTYRRSPERVTSVMIAAFAGKLVFFGAYVAVMLNVLSLSPMPFIVSFTSYFIALHVTEAFYLRRLLR